MFLEESISFVYLATSVNQPNFCPSVTWNTDGVTIGNSSIVGTNPYGLFVNLNNTLFVVSQQYQRILIWSDGAINPYRNISGNLGTPYSIFTTVSGDIFVDNYVSYTAVYKWSLNSSNSSSNYAMTIPQSCYSLFVDISNTIYCAAYSSHKIVKKWLFDNSNTSSLAAGTGIGGNSGNQLYSPAGIYVDSNFNLYVGDSGNNRIQFFPFGRMNATTLVSSTTPGTIALYAPNGVVLDMNGYLFISDSSNHRIVGQGPTGFQCIIGCSGTSGSSTSQLSSPRQISFDTYGNLYVADQGNNRIQKFILASNSCSKFFFSFLLFELNVYAYHYLRSLL